MSDSQAASEESLSFKSENKPREVLGKSYSDAYVGSKQSVEGSVSWPVSYGGSAQGSILKYAFGSCSSAVNGSGYTHTFTLSNNLVCSGLTLYVDRDATDLGSAFYYTGCGINSLSLSQDQEDYLKASVDVIGANEFTSTRKTPSIPAFKGVTWDQVTAVSVAGTAYNAKVIDFQVESSLADDRFNLGNRQRAGLGRGGVRKVSGKVAVELSNTTLLSDFKNGTEVAVSGVWTGPVAAGATNYGLSLSIPRAVLQGNSPNVSEQGPIVVEYPFIGFSNEGSGNEITLTLTNLDASYL